MKIKDLIFDLDGTLWDSSENICKAWNNVFKENNLSYHFEVSDFDLLFGKTDEEIADMVFHDLNHEESLNLLYKCFKEEIEVIKNYGGKLFDDTIETLKDLKNDYNLYIVSNCQCGYIEHFLEYYKIADLFTDIECAENTKLPKKDNIRLIKDKHNIKSSIYIGDTESDFKAAEDSDTYFIYASYGFGNIKNYKYSINSLKEIRPVIKEIEKDKLI